MNPFKVGQRLVGHGQPAFIIAELAWAHDGSPDKAIRIARGAAEAGADAFSIHLTSLPDYMARHYGNPDGVSAGKPASETYRYLERLSLAPNEMGEVCAEARRTGLSLCLMPNDFPSLELARSFEPDAYVLAPACFLEADFVQALGREGRPVVLRIGGATLGEIERVIQWLRGAGAHDLLLLHGFQVYPTRLEETHLRALPVLRQVFGCHVGLADHLDGGDDLALVIPLLALALGAVAIEKHITWDRAERGEDFESALDPARLKTFVGYVRAAETALGDAAVPPLSPDVLKYRHVSRKRVVASADLPAGVVLEPRHLACKRSDAGALADERPNLLGRRARVAISADDPITWDRLE